MTDRIVARLLGGTGNQLFQYALGRALADRLGCDLVLDNRYVSDSVDRGDCFEHFGQARFHRSDDLPPAKQDGMLRYGLWRLFGRDPAFRRERGLGFDPAVLTVPANTYLHGYWQSPKYFAAIDAQLRKDLAFTTPLTGSNAQMAEKIGQSPASVSVHVRRGDYIASGSFAACSPDYYRKAVETLTQKLDTSCTCFVFSNDPDWARNNLELGQPTIIVDINDETTGHFDMHLQSLCDHNVIANSTFSWWGAWLNPNPDKTVIAPRHWFSGPELANPDLIPDSWIRI